MNRDFTLNIYVELCKSIIKSGFKIQTVKDYLTKNINKKKSLVMRHDVDSMPYQALKMAKLERELGFTSTYYFRYVKGVFDEKIIQEIHDLGHEIGYHYEVLAVSNGDKGKAIKLFENALLEFRKIVNIDTICMHGSPLSKWNDLDLWDNYDFKNYGILGEAFMSIDYDNVDYFTDTGRSWNGGYYNVRDVVQSNKPKTIVSSTNQLIMALKYINNDVSINTHPQRWHNGVFRWSIELFAQNIKNIGKTFLKLSYKK